LYKKKKTRNTLNNNKKKFKDLARQERTVDLKLIFL